MWTLRSINCVENGSMTTLICFVSIMLVVSSSFFIHISNQSILISKSLMGRSRKMISTLVLLQLRIHTIFYLHHNSFIFVPHHHNDPHVVFPPKLLQKPFISHSLTLNILHEQFQSTQQQQQNRKMYVMNLVHNSLIELKVTKEIFFFSLKRLWKVKNQSMKYSQNTYNDGEQFVWSNTQHTHNHI